MNKIIFVTENQFNGKKTFGIGTQEAIRKMNTSFYMTTGENMSFTKCLREVDENKMWKIYFFLKFSFEFNGVVVGFNSFNKTVTLSDRESDMNVESYITQVVEKIKWFDSSEDVTHKFNSMDWSKKDDAILVIESEDTHDELAEVSA